MFSFFRSLSKSKLGTAIIALFFLMILVGFAVGDLANIGSGNIGFGSGSSTLAKAGDQVVDQRQLSDAMQRRLQQVRQQDPNADYATILPEFERILNALIDERSLIGFAARHGFHLSKRLIDAEIAQIPQTRGLNGQFSEHAYQGFLAQQRLTDREVREIISASLLERLMVAPVAANARVAVGMATPYASMLLEAREGETAAIPIDLFKAGLRPTDADLQRHYEANRARYMVPEQRVVRFARIGPQQVANVTASEQEITAFYNANRATYEPKDTRVVSQAVVPDQATANAIAARAKGGATIQAAAAPAGANAAVTSLDAQTRQSYASIAGERAAAAVFAAPSGSVVGPVQSDFGWVVAKIQSVKTEGGKPLAAARAEIAAKLTADKRRQAVEDLVDQVQTAVDDGSNFVEAAAAAKLTPEATPLIMANGTSRTNASFRAPAELAAAIKAAFEIAGNDPPEIVSLPNNAGYVLVAPGDVVPAAPAPLASIRERVATDWINDQAQQRARAAATAIAAKAAQGMPLAQAVRSAGVSLPAIRPLAARRMQIATAQAPVPPAIRTLFSLTQGKSRLVADPRSRTFYVVKVNKIVPGNALLQPALVGQMQRELQSASGDDYVAQLLNAIRQDMKVQRNESAIAAEKQRLVTTGG
jgi:peptidyl-prolyl cis-trans isomerase D